MLLQNIAFQDSVVYYLEMKQAPNFVLLQKEEINFVSLEKPIDLSTYREYYAAVGLPYHWLDRLVMPDDELVSKINAPNALQFLMKISGETAGFLELIVEDEFIEIQYFGLYPAFVGKGYGKYFLHWSINKAWSFAPKYVQLNTCSLDHPSALSVYKSAGFIKTHQTVEQRRVLL